MLGCVWISVVLSKSSQWESAENKSVNEIAGFTHFQLDFPNLCRLLVFSLSLSRIKHRKPNPDLIYTSKIWVCSRKPLKLFCAYSDENESGICLINSPNPQKVNESKRK